MEYRDIVIIRSGGDIASGIIERLHKCGFKVVVLEVENPSSIRRNVCFGEAVYKKSMTINGLTSNLANDINEMEKIIQKGNIPVLVDEEGLPKASEIKGCVAKEVGERFPKIVGLAPIVI